MSLKFILIVMSRDLFYLSDFLFLKRYLKLTDWPRFHALDDWVSTSAADSQDQVAYLR